MSILTNVTVSILHVGPISPFTGTTSDLPRHMSEGREGTPSVFLCRCTTRTSMGDGLYSVLRSECLLFVHKPYLVHKVYQTRTTRWTIVDPFQIQSHSLTSGLWGFSVGKTDPYKIKKSSKKKNWNFKRQVDVKQSILHTQIKLKTKTNRGYYKCLLKKTWLTELNECKSIKRSKSSK